MFSSVIEFAICGLTLLSVSGLVGFHTCLIANMKTTNEDVSKICMRSDSVEMFTVVNSDPSYNTMRRMFN